jgi:hypothetical protein
MFQHKNPIRFEHQYQYYIRCVNRFREYLKNPERKVFVMFRFNMGGGDKEREIDEIKQLRDTLARHTSNFELLVIFHFPHAPHTSHRFDVEENKDHDGQIVMLNIFTRSSSTGVVFTDVGENAYLDDVLKKRYCK